MVQAESVDPVWAMFSGGHDSLASTILASRHPNFAGVLHIHTGIGIEETREFVHETCREHGWALIELRPTVSYEDLVLERGGFPGGPMAHNSMVWHLKQKPLSEWIKAGSFKSPVGLVTGIRTAESNRRAKSGIAIPIRKDGSRKVWISPILDWTKQDCNVLIAREGFRRNQVVDVLHRSGECLCGALARSGEIHDIDYWYPEVGERIHALEVECENRGLKSCVWASRESVIDGQEQLFAKSEVLCSSCEARYAD